MDNRIDLLGRLYIAYHIILLVLGLLAFILLFSLAAAADMDELAILAIVGIIAGFFQVLLAAPGIIGGVGLLKRKNWARILVIILSVLNLLAIPFGTALGIFGLRLLLNEETTPYFAGK